MICRPSLRSFRHASIPLALAATVAALSGCAPVSFTIGSGPSDEHIHATRIIDEHCAGARVGVIDIAGLIHNGRSRSLLSVSENPVARLHDQLEYAAGDDSIKAVLLRINSPGGTVTASDAMYREVKRFKANTHKPVVVCMMDVAASGGYYVSCAADRIVAYPSTVTASIGVILQTVSLKPAMDRVGIHAEAFTSGPNKAAGSPLGDMTDSHRAVLRAMVDDFYTRFRQIVRDARPNIPADQFDTLTDGRVVTGNEAIKVGIVDELGDIYDAHAAAKKLAGLKHADLVTLARKDAYVGNVYAGAPNTEPHAAAPTGMTQINLAQFNLTDPFGSGDATSTFLYLWRP
ncbi:MAG: signal peptide peptidase SppA [Phycisphaera sp.]|nr:signal peptide peptidase SppA [Phycisphaera sp.]